MTKSNISKLGLSLGRGRGRLFIGGTLALSASLTAGCLERPVVEQKPNTSNVFVEQIQNAGIDKIDLLFVIDNSVSMADKQEILKDAVPKMVERLVTPACKDGSSTAGCELQFEPIEDIHIGVITSSLGGHGSAQCEAPQKNDRSLLMPIVRTGLPASEPAGFLAWNGPPQDPNQLSTDFQAHVVAAGEGGCGFEAPLEAWYRFLVDPAPPVGVVRNGDVSASTGVDQQTLDQRAAFLRDDSLVAIVVLTDENDCSAMDGGSYYDNAGFGWLVSAIREAGAAKEFAGFPPASVECGTNPNAACCYSCLGAVPEGCTDSCPREVDDSVLPMADPLDRANARCFQNQRRFGVDLLYPAERYVAGLRDSSIRNSQDGAEVPNPLLVHPVTGVQRPDGLVFFAGIVGVPWQDIATKDTLNTPTSLSYLTAAELAGEGAPTLDDGSANPLAGKTRWDVILGEPNLPTTSPTCKGGGGGNSRCGAVPVAPLDPFMIESQLQRTGVNPITGDAAIPLSGSGSSPINGHEYDNEVPTNTDNLPSNDDLQYSCIFKLATPKVCTAGDAACDCDPAQPDRNSPLCKADASVGTAEGDTQYWGKAYPATRVLEVLRDFGDNSIVGSICPKVLDPSSPDFGYNPAVNAIVDRLAEKLSGQCLPRPLTVDEATGQVPCTVVEATEPELGIVGCDLAGRRPVDPGIAEVVRKKLAESGTCSTDCASWNLCEIVQYGLGSPDQGECFGAGNVSVPGYCYIDPAKGPAAGGSGAGCVADDPLTWANCTNVNTDPCSATQKRLLQFAGDNTPVNDSVIFVACVGDAASETGILPPIPAAGEGTGTATATATGTATGAATGTATGATGTATGAGAGGAAP